MKVKLPIRIQHKLIIYKLILTKIFPKYLYYKHKFNLITRKHYLHDLKSAILNNIPYAMGKQGTELLFLYYKPFRVQAKKCDIEKYEENMSKKIVKQIGIYPADSNFIMEKLIPFYVAHMKNINCLGSTYYTNEELVFNYYKVQNNLIHYTKQEPDKSIPYREVNCFFPYFKNKRLLIVCPFSQVLKERATKEIYEAVWKKIGRKWFYPASVESVEFPYGFDERTWSKFPTVIDLFNYISSEMNKKVYDIALIAAGGLGVPLASFAKEQSKIGLDLGGSLQIMFGVLGGRWRNLENWKKLYFNDAWIDMPEKYHPEQKDICDGGAYW